jgi:hypothetical protein
VGATAHPDPGRRGDAGFPFNAFRRALPGVGVDSATDERGERVYFVTTSAAVTSLPLILMFFRRRHIPPDAFPNRPGIFLRMTTHPTSAGVRLISIACIVLASTLSGAISTNRAIAEPTRAVPTTVFLNSIGIDSTFPDRGQPLDKTIEMIRYGGFRWVRAGTEGLSDHGPTTLQTYVDLHHATGVRFSWGLGSGGTNVKRLVETAKTLAAGDALLAFEGNNEPNNWGVNYQGEKGGGRAPSWMAVAKLQRDLYQAVKGDPALAKYPVWSISENGAERDNVGLQFLTIPDGADALMPAGTKYADFANCHNYFYHPNSSQPADNKTWNAADPSPACRVDGLYGNYGRTWAKHFAGYPQDPLNALPRVTTETGATIGGPITEQLHALNLLSMYLDQFKRGWSCTSVYILRDRTDEGGNQAFGFFQPDFTPRKAAVCLHNLTTILADTGAAPPTPGSLDYAIPNEPETVHDLLLQHSDGTFELVVWDERLTGTDAVTVQFSAKHATARIYDPTLGTDVVKTASDASSLDLTLSDHPLVIALPQK